MYLQMFAPMIGKTLKSISISNDQRFITLDFHDAPTKTFRVVSECCSHSWIEHLEVPPNVDGAKISAVSEDYLEPWDKHQCIKTTDQDGWESSECGHDHLKVYHTIFHADRGDITLEYRNDSNGYYGGYLEDTKEETDNIGV